MDQRISGRTEQLNLKARPDFKRKLKIMAAKEGCLMIEIMEKALKLYEKQHKKPKQPTKKLANYVKIIPAKPKSQPKLIPYSHLNFTCDRCGEEYEQETAYSPARHLTELDHQPTYCSDCVVVE